MSHNAASRHHFLIAANCLFLLAWAYTARYFFDWVQHRPATRLADPILTILPSHDLSAYIFILLYALIALSLPGLLRNIIAFAVALQSYTLLSLFRIAAMTIVPLDAPDNLHLLVDPFVDNAFYGQHITKDLFFSGHVSLIVMLGMLQMNRTVKAVFYSAAGVLALMLLIQHAHYTIDVVFAPIFSWIAVHLSRRIVNV